MQRISVFSTRLNGSKLYSKPELAGQIGIFPCGRRASHALDPGYALKPYPVPGYATCMDTDGAAPFQQGARRHLYAPWLLTGINMKRL
jgi:hypothetical protein